MHSHAESLDLVSRIGRARAWPGLAAMLAAIGMLFAFGHVVSQGVQQGDLRRIAEAALFNATWRCNAERTKHVRDDCLLLLGPAPRGHHLERNHP